MNVCERMRYKFALTLGHMRSQYLISRIVQKFKNPKQQELLELEIKIQLHRIRLVLLHNAFLSRHQRRSRCVFIFHVRDSRRVHSHTALSLGESDVRVKRYTKKKKCSSQREKFLLEKPKR